MTSLARFLILLTGTIFIRLRAALILSGLTLTGLILTGLLALSILLILLLAILIAPAELFIAILILIAHLLYLIGKKLPSRWVVLGFRRLLERFTFERCADRAIAEVNAV